VKELTFKFDIDADLDRLEDAVWNMHPVERNSSGEPLYTKKQHLKRFMVKHFDRLIYLDSDRAARVEAKKNALSLGSVS
jgi:hypothetical protein